MGPKAQSSPAEPPQSKHLNVRQAAFIGVGAMVGAGIFALLGAAGAVAGAAVWLSFLTLLAILVLGIALDFGWKRARAGRARQAQAVH